MGKFILAMLVVVAATFIPLTARADVGLGYDTVAGVTGFGVGVRGAGLGANFVLDVDSGTAAFDGESFVKADRVAVAAEVLIPLTSLQIGEGGNLRPLLSGGVSADATNFDGDRESLTNIGLNFSVGAEWRPIERLGLLARTGVQIDVLDGQDNTWSTAGTHLGNLGVWVLFW